MKYSGYWIVSVVNSISATSMPINEFIIYRAKRNYDCRQTVIVCDEIIPSNVNLPNEVDFQLTGMDEKRIRQIVREIEAESIQKKLQVIYHIHHQKAGLRFCKAALGLGIRKRVLFTVHSNYKDRNYKYKISSALSVLIAQRANCVSNDSFDSYSNFIKRVKKENFAVISNGVDFERVTGNLVETKSFENKKLKIVCVGRMIPLKNHEFLISLLKHLPDCKLILIGTGEKEKEIRKLVIKNNLAQRVEFTGLISRDEVFRKLSECCIYVSASYIEGMPVSVLEAMSAGLIPVLSDIGPHREIKSECEDAIVLPLDENVWVKVINRLMIMPEKELTILSKKIQSEVKQKYSLDTMHKKYFNLYHSMY